LFFCSGKVLDLKKEEFFSKSVQGACLVKSKPNKFRLLLESNF
jgi:hypothetical protein